MLVNILYSAPPDGDDASSTFASRVSDYCSQDGTTLGCVGQLEVNDDGNAILPWRTQDDDGIPSNAKTLTIFLISCSADGSVNRQVRKIMRKIPQKGTSDGASKGNSHYYVVAALGHARCENSANQMADTIFSTARRFDKLLSGLYVSLSSRLETQVELMGPDEEFDPWVKSVLQSLEDTVA